MYFYDSKMSEKIEDGSLLEKYFILKWVPVQNGFSTPENEFSNQLFTSTYYVTVVIDYFLNTFSANRSFRPRVVSLTASSQTDLRR